MYFSKKRRYLTEINVIPYVDVMLVLLVIFMVTAPFMIQGIDIDLPEVNSQPIEKANLENVTISINSKGEYFIDLDSLKDEIFKIYLKMNFNFNQLVNSKEIYKNLPNYKARGLIYQSILLSDSVEKGKFFPDNGELNLETASLF